MTIKEFNLTPMGKLIYLIEGLGLSVEVKGILLAVAECAEKIYSDAIVELLKDLDEEHMGITKNECYNKIKGLINNEDRLQK